MCSGWPVASKQSSSLYLFSPKQGEAENSKLDEDLGELWRDLFCLFCFDSKRWLHSHSFISQCSESTWWKHMWYSESKENKVVYLNTLLVVKEWKIVNFKLGNLPKRKDFLHSVTSLGQRKDLSPRQDSNLLTSQTPRMRSIHLSYVARSWRARPYTRFIFDTRPVHC